MKKNVYNFVKTIDEVLALEGPVLEIGSLRIEEQLNMPLFSEMFEKRNYTGCDMRNGIGVDVVTRAENLNFKDKKFKTVLLLEVIEHTENLFEVINEAIRVTDTDGFLIITSVFNYKIHNSPSDFWRFTPAALDFLLKEFPNRLIGYQGVDRMPHSVFAVATKNINFKFPDNLTCELEKILKNTQVHDRRTIKNTLYLAIKGIKNVFNETEERNTRFFEMTNEKKGDYLFD